MVINTDLRHPIYQPKQPEATTMPYLIEFIDKIARTKGRDVLLVGFRPPEDVSADLWDSEADIDWQRLPVRRQIIDWLETQGIAWQPCDYMADENSITSYEGQIYIDAPFDEANPTYRQLAAYLEMPDGTPRQAGAWFYVLPLARAMENAHHDEPGFWERWAENF